MRVDIISIVKSAKGLAKNATGFVSKNKHAYVEGVLHSELKAISEETDALFEEFCVGRFVVFE